MTMLATKIGVDRPREWERRVGNLTQAVSVDDRRLYARPELKSDVTFDSPSCVFSGIEHDLAARGVFMETECPPHVGEHVDLVLRIGDGAPLEVRGVVRWVRPPGPNEPGGCGIRFEGLPDEQARLLNEAVSRLKVRPGEVDEAMLDTLTEIPDIASGCSRAFERAEIKVDVDVSTESQFITGLSENISAGGVFIATLCPPEVGQQVRLALRLFHDETLQVEGVVRWVREDSDGNLTGCGVQFVDLSPEQLACIDAALEELHDESVFFED